MENIRLSEVGGPSVWMRNLQKGLLTSVRRWVGSGAGHSSQTAPPQVMVCRQPHLALPCPAAVQELKKVETMLNRQELAALHHDVDGLRGELLRLVDVWRQAQVGRAGGQVAGRSWAVRQLTLATARQCSAVVGGSELQRTHGSPVFLCSAG